MKIIPKIDYKEAWQEYHDHNVERDEDYFFELWYSKPKTIRLVYGWLSAYADVFEWLSRRWLYDGDIYIYPALTKNACTKNGKIYFGIERDFNHELDLGIVIHEIAHIAFRKDEKQTEAITKTVVEMINESFGLSINHG